MTSEGDIALLTVEDLSVSFGHDGKRVRVADRVSLAVRRARTTALVGESGCGKSVTASAIMGLLPPAARVDDGRVGLHSRQKNIRDLLSLDARAMAGVRGAHIAMVFQDPVAALNPVLTIGEQLIETILLHQQMSKADARRRAIEMLDRVGIAEPHRRVDEYAHAFSGGMCQRAMIAMALCCGPELLIADEPTTALDTVTRRQILELLSRLQSESELGLLLITHDLSIVKEYADRVYVMYAGRIVERAPAGVLFDAPLHPYTRGLIDALPRLQAQRTRLPTIPGSVPDPGQRPTGCPFHPRCTTAARRATERPGEAVERPLVVGSHTLRRCVEPGPGSGDPALVAVDPDHAVACWEA